MNTVNMSAMQNPARRPDSHWASMPESGTTTWLWIMY